MKHIGKVRASGHQGYQGRYIESDILKGLSLPVAYIDEGHVEV